MVNKQGVDEAELMLGALNLFTLLNNHNDSLLI